MYFDRRSILILLLQNAVDPGPAVFQIDITPENFYLFAVLFFNRYSIVSGQIEDLPNIRPVPKQIIECLPLLLQLRF